MSKPVIYEVDCSLDADRAADFDAWLPGHVREVLACPGFLGASIHAFPPVAGQPARRRTQYRLENQAALDRYFAEHAPRLRADAAARYGEQLRCSRSILEPQTEALPAALQPARCLDCDAPVAGKYCAKCGQASGLRLLSVREVLGDVTHSLLHLDSRVWKTLQLLAFRPGQLTSEFIAGRRQRYLPPFRLYLVLSVLFFALSALLPGAQLTRFETSPEVWSRVDGVLVPVDPETFVAAPARSGSATKSPCQLDLRGPLAHLIGDALLRACRQIVADGGKLLVARFAATAPKLMFLFLPLMASVSLLFYWRPRRLYAEHLVLFLHNHALVFLVLSVVGLTNSVTAMGGPPVAMIGFTASIALWLYLPYYVFRSMRVVYGEGRIRTGLKFIAQLLIYQLLLITLMIGGIVYSIFTL